jgi:hypothetical protein
VETMGAADDGLTPSQRWAVLSVVEMLEARETVGTEVERRTEERVADANGLLLRGARTTARAGGRPMRGWVRHGVTLSGPVRMVLVAAYHAAADPYDDAAMQAMMASLAATAEAPPAPVL